MSANRWQRDGRTVYSLVETGYRRGEPVLENEFVVQVQRGHGTTDEQAEDLARRIQIALNASE